jgi:hypothetical protein
MGKRVGGGASERAASAVAITWAVTLRRGQFTVTSITFLTVS